MKETKKRQINRLKKISIWPALFGIFFATVIVASFLIALLYVYFNTLIGVKFSEGNAYVKNAVEAMEATNNGINTNSLLMRYRYITGIVPDIDGMCLLDQDNNVTDSFGAEKIDFDEIIMFNHIESENLRAKLYISKYEKNLEFDDEGNIVFDLSFMLAKSFNSLSVKELRDAFSGRGGWNGSEVMALGVWYVIEDSVTSGRIAVHYRYVFTTSDFSFMVIAVAGLVLLFAVLMIYHIVSVIRVAAMKRRTYKFVFSDLTTGGHNAQFFYRKCKQLYPRVKSGREQYAIVNIRLEKYRSLIACYGMRTTDRLIELLYMTIKKCAGKREAFAHMESGDFAMMLAYDQEEQLNERLKYIRQQLECVGQGSRLYFNIGVCKVDDVKEDPEDVYNRAYIARSIINDENADAISWFSEKVKEQQIWERKVEHDMQGALERSEFKMYLQPKYTTNGEKVGGAEALVRWIHPTEGFIPPGRFIPIFEKNGFILQLDDYMINEVAKYQAKWISEGKQVVPVSVNVSRAHFLNDNLAEHIRDIIDSYCVPHDCIELELTESAFFDDKNALIETVRRMQQYGFKVSMDDFGAGYSSLNSLKELPLDVIKLDAEFFRGEDNEERGKLIVTETIDLAKQLGMHIVAEGIETREQVDFLKERDCDLIQGFFFAKPMPTDEFEKCAFGE